MVYNVYLLSILTANGLPVHTMRTLSAIGTQAPDLKNHPGKKVLLNIFPSLDTPTCASAMRQFNEIAAQFNDMLILCISADLPFAQNAFARLKTY